MQAQTHTNTHTHIHNQLINEMSNEQCHKNEKKMNKFEVMLINVQMYTNFPSKFSISWSCHINVFKVKVTQKMAYRCGKFKAYCLLSCRDNFCLCRPTVTLNQGQNH